MARQLCRGGDEGVQVFAIYGKYRFQDRHFLAYGLEYIGGETSAAITIPRARRWRWSRRLRIQQGQSAEQILWTLAPIVDARLVRLGTHVASPSRSTE